jgi:hypothetical protein
MTIGIVTIVKLLPQKGTIGTSNKQISFGVFLIVISLFSQTFVNLLGASAIHGSIWEPILDLIFFMGLAVGIGAIFFGLWKISILFDEIHNKAVSQTLLVSKDDETE